MISSSSISQHSLTAELTHLASRRLDRSKSTQFLVEESQFRRRPLIAVQTFGEKRRARTRVSDAQSGINNYLINTDHRSKLISTARAIGKVFPRLQLAPRAAMPEPM
jgi:hypothetical protein